MASAGLKRPSDFELNCSPHVNGPSGSSSPIWPVGNANKKRCLNNFVAQQLQQPPHQNHHNHQQQHSYHYQIQQHQNQHASSSNTTGGQINSPFKDPSAILSPLSDDVNFMIKSEVHKAHNHCNNNLSATNSNNNSVTNPNNNVNNGHEAPVLTIRQTQMICEKLIREREMKLREEYDKILISKLAEQYDTFVKYTHDHIEKRYNESNSHQASYLS